MVLAHHPSSIGLLHWGSIMGRRTWIKVWCLPWTEGRIREAPLAIRGTFITLCCLVGDSKFADDGLLQVAPEIGFSDNQIAGMLHCDVRTWAEHKTYLQDFKKPDGQADPLIQVGNDNIIKVIEWDRFEPDYRRYQAKCHSETMTPSHSKAKREKKKEKEKKEGDLGLGVSETDTPQSDGKHPTGKEFIAHWNSKPGLDKINTWGKERNDKLRGLRTNAEFRLYWRDAIDALSRDPYCMERPYIRTADCFLSNDKHKNSNWNKSWEREITQGIKVKRTKEQIEAEERARLERIEEEEANKRGELSVAGKVLMEKLGSLGKEIK